MLDIGANAVEIEMQDEPAARPARWSPFRRRAGHGLRTDLIGPAPPSILTPISESARPAEFAVRLAPTTPMRVGRDLSISFRLDDAHFFDATGTRIDAGRRFTYLG